MSLYYIFRTTFVFLLIGGAISLIGSYATAQLPTTMASTFVYWLSFLNYLNPVLDVSVIFSMINFGLNIIISIAYVYLVWITAKLLL